MVRPRILIVDDERDIRELLRMAFEARGWIVNEAGDIGTAYRLLRSQETDLCVTDMRLPDGNGIELVEAMADEKPDLPVIVITAYGSIETAVHALQAGAFDFVSKPINTDVLRAIAQHALQRNPDNARSPSALIGDSSAMTAVRDAVARVAGNQAPVAITGESGTGKQLAAREIHRLASPVERPFVTVNCAALPEERMIDAFFGGGDAEAVTSHRDGLLRAARGGTLYLDEVETLPAFMQARLLEVLHERRIPSADGTSGEVFDARVISSSTTGLQAAVQAGRLRHDLFYRLNVIELRVPPLRERPEDLPLLAGLIHAAIQRHWGRPVPTLSVDALASLQRYPFPGNYRELENIIERASATAGGDTIRPEDLEFPTVTAEPADSASVKTPVADADNLPGRLAADERAAILAALEKTRWNRTAAARLLGLSFRQLRYRIKKFGLEDAPE
jgi:two-component system response regulator PilR (NtrC family)